MNYINQNDIEWRKVKYLKSSEDGPEESHKWEYELILNEPLASWDVFAVWEKERIHSMQEHLKQGMVLFDIGTEQGWCNLVYARMVGYENMVLIEPTPEFWPNIKALWYKNTDVPPLACYSGLFSDKTTDNTVLPLHTFPEGSDGPIIDRNSYRYIHEHGHEVPQITLDDYVSRSGVIPGALTIDVEGAELLILRGSEQTLKNYKPKVWVSIHDELGERDYGVKSGEVIEFMKQLGYEGEYLATDHEIHYCFKPKEVV